MRGMDHRNKLKTIGTFGKIDRMPIEVSQRFMSQRQRSVSQSCWRKLSEVTWNLSAPQGRPTIEAGVPKHGYAPTWLVPCTSFTAKFPNWQVIHSAQGQKEYTCPTNHTVDWNPAVHQTRSQTRKTAYALETNFWCQVRPTNTKPTKKFRSKSLCADLTRGKVATCLPILRISTVTAKKSRPKNAKQNVPLDDSLPVPGSGNFSQILELWLCIAPLAAPKQIPGASGGKSQPFSNPTASLSILSVCFMPVWTPSPSKLNFVYLTGLGGRNVRSLYSTGRFPQWRTNIHKPECKFCQHVKQVTTFDKKHGKRIEQNENACEWKD